MTRAEAIYRLKNTAWLGSDADRVATEEAVQTAIEALKERRPMFYISNTVEQEKLKDMTKNFPPMFVTSDTEKIELIREQQWIPCSERLPKDDDWQIVTILDERGDTPYRYSDFGWYLNRAECWIIDAEQRTDVIAWMPLPEPYKGE